VTANIAATFDFRGNAGFHGQLYERGGTPLARNAYALTVGGSLADNPTIRIVPVQGQAFTQGILTPLDQHKLDFLVHEGRNWQMVLRLTVLARELEEGTTGASC
jgi:hypothetical protein